MEKDKNIEESNAYAWSDIGADQVALFYRNEENIASYASRTGCWPRKPQHPMYAPSLSDTMALLESFRKNGNPFENGWYDNSLFLNDWIDHSDHDWRLITEPSVAGWAEEMIFRSPDSVLSSDYIDEVEEGLRNLMKVLDGKEAPIPESYWDYRFTDIADSPSLALEDEPFILESLMSYLEDEDEAEDEDMYFYACILADPEYPKNDTERAMGILESLMHEAEDEMIGARSALLFADLTEDDEARFFALTEAAALGSRNGRIALAQEFIERGAEKAALSILRRFSDEFLSTMLKGYALPELIKAHAFIALHAETEEEESRYLKLARLGMELRSREDLDVRFRDMIRLHNLGMAERYYIGMLAESAIRDERTEEEAEDLLEMAEEEIENTEWPDYEEAEETHDFLSDRLSLNFNKERTNVLEVEIKDGGRRIAIRRKGNDSFFYEDEERTMLLEELTLEPVGIEGMEDKTIEVDRVDENGSFLNRFSTVLSPVESWKTVSMTEAVFED